MLGEPTVTLLFPPEGNKYIKYKYICLANKGIGCLTAKVKYSVEKVNMQANSL